MDDIFNIQFEKCKDYARMEVNLGVFHVFIYEVDGECTMRHLIEYATSDIRTFLVNGRCYPGDENETEYYGRFTDDELNFILRRLEVDFLGKR